MYDLGFFGTGNMGAALAGAAAKSGGTIILHNRTAAKAKALAETLGCQTGDAQAAARESRFLFLGVKPQNLPELLGSLRETLRARTDRFVLVSMAAGLTLASLRELLGFEASFVRIMPNLPVALGKGVILLSPGAGVSEEELCALERFLAPAGLLLRMPEEKLDAGSAISGCGPAFAYQFLDALALGGVQSGLAYEQALTLAAQTLIGASEMVLQSGKAPGKLVSEVCSPAGTTIEGIAALEAQGFRAAAMSAVTASYAKTKALAKG